MGLHSHNSAYFYSMLWARHNPVIYRDRLGISRGCHDLQWARILSACDATPALRIPYSSNFASSRNRLTSLLSLNQESEHDSSRLHQILPARLYNQVLLRQAPGLGREILSSGRLQAQPSKTSHCTSLIFLSNNSQKFNRSMERHSK